MSKYTKPSELKGQEKRRQNKRMGLSVRQMKRRIVEEVRAKKPGHAIRNLTTQATNGELFRSCPTIDRKES